MKKNYCVLDERLYEHEGPMNKMVLNLDFVFVRVGEDTYTVKKNRFNGLNYSGFTWKMCKALMDSNN